MAHNAAEEDRNLTSLGWTLGVCIRSIPQEASGNFRLPRKDSGYIDIAKLHPKAAEQHYSTDLWVMFNVRRSWKVRHVKC